MAKSTKSKKRNKPGNYKTLIVLFIVLVAIAIASVIISYFITNDQSDKLSQETEQSDQLTDDEQKNIKTSLEGTWVSNYDGAILTISGLTFDLDLPSVDESLTVEGTIAVEKNLVTFMNTKGKEVCKDIEGHYQFTFEEDEISFKLIKDDCESRKERMTVSWFSL